MDNNTAQNGTIQYPDLTKSVGTPQVSNDDTTNVATAPVSQASDDKILQDLSAQIETMNNPPTQSHVSDVFTGIPTVELSNTKQVASPSTKPLDHLTPQEQSEEEVTTIGIDVEDQGVGSDKEDVAAQKLVENVEAVAQENTATPSPVNLGNIQEAMPINKDEPSNNRKGTVSNELQDIIPGEKVPKALKREPKEENVSQPLGEPTNVERGSSMKKIDELLRYAIQHNASDLHITVGYPPIVRIDGELKEVSESIITPEEAEELILPILSDEKKELLEVNKEIDLAHYHEGDPSGRFRINVYHTMKNISAAFRLIPSRIRTIEELFLPSIYNQFAQLKQGFILITGPTGHGKSTTLAAILEEVNTTRFTHIVTIEDPIEYVFEGKKSLIDQREMNEDTHSWPIALRSALRQDPDVILVGEMRDYETIASAITLAETGHLVFATLHTNNAAQTVDRIIDVFPENQQPQIRLQLSNILEAIVAQRLIPLDKGGRRAVSEIMIANPAVRNLVREAKTHQIDNVIRTSSDIGMISLERSLVSLVREGVISVQRAQEYAVFPEEVLRLLKS